MVQLRARRTRRRVVSRSSDEAEDSSASNVNSDDDAERLKESSRKQLPLSLQSRKSHPSTSASQSNNTSTPSTPRSTPKKTKAPVPKSKSPDQSNTRTLYSFFNVATQRQQQSYAASNTFNSAAAPKQEEDADFALDAISDDDDDLNGHAGQADPNPAAARPKKRLHDGMDPLGLISGSQKYIKRTDGSREPTIATFVEPDLRTWNEKYGPTELAELVVHKKKVSDVRQWLENALSGHKYSRLLVLKGAAGSGKTATLSMLSRALKFEMVEWRNPTMSDNLGPNTVSASAQFDDFIGRGSRFGGLELVSASSLEDESVLAETIQGSSSDKEVLVVEEFPNNLTRATAALHAFRSSVVQFLERSYQQTKPLVMVISEMVASDSSSSLDNFTAHRLLGPEILHHPCVSVIEFNRVAPTFIAKALNMTLQKHHRETRSSYEPSNGALKKLSEFGDVRNAISTLEFLCTQRDDVKAPVRSINSKPKSRSAKSKAASDPSIDGLSSEELSIISLRESSIGLFHALGRVLYNKRNAIESTSLSSNPPSSGLVPAHLSKFARPLVSEVDLDSLIDETGTDTSTFLSALHENYLLSCFSPDGNMETTMEHIIGCLDSLTDADLLNDYSNYAINVTGSSGLRQAELSFQTAVRGLLFNLPYPVKRQAPPGKGKADAHRMFYPTSLKLWRNREEMQGLIEMFAQKVLRGTLLPPLTRSKTLKPSGQKAFKLVKEDSSTSNEHKSSTADNGHETLASEDSSPRRVIVGSGHSVRHEMLLERLPYMKQIYSRNTAPGGSNLLKQIDQVTQFSGVGIMQDDDEDEPPEGNDTPLATGGSSSLGKNDKEGRGRGHGIFTSSATGKTGGSLDGLAAVAKLVLSDDDIEDD